MGFMVKYPIDLRIKVLSDYKQGKVGYKTLAKKFGLQRDTVRYWVLKSKSYKNEFMDSKNIETVSEEAKNIEFYKTEAEYWKAYAKKLESIRFPESKKNSNRNNQRITVKRIQNKHSLYDCKYKSGFILLSKKLHKKK